VERLRLIGAVLQLRAVKKTDIRSPLASREISLNLAEGEWREG